MLAKRLLGPVLTLSQNDEETKLLPQRIQCHWSLQPPVMPSGEFQLCYHPILTRDWRPLSLHESCRARTPALQDVGTNQIISELQQGP